MVFPDIVAHRKKFVLILCILAACASFLVFFFLHHSSAPSAQFSNADKAQDQYLATQLKSATTTYFSVDRVIDGDTFIVRVGDGKATIRVLGMNTPEVVDPRKPVQCFGPEASARAHQLLDGVSVSLALDPSQDDIDKYGRVLAYVHLRDGTFFDEEMIREGYAYEYTFKKPYLYQKDFKSTQAIAKNKQIGLWSPKTCAGKF